MKTDEELRSELRCLSNKELIDELEGPGMTWDNMVLRETAKRILEKLTEEKE